MERRGGGGENGCDKVGGPEFLFRREQAEPGTLLSGRRKIFGRTLVGKPARLWASFANFGVGVPRETVGGARARSQVSSGSECLPEWKCRRN